MKAREYRLIPAFNCEFGKSKFGALEIINGKVKDPEKIMNHASNHVIEKQAYDSLMEQAIELRDCILNNEGITNDQLTQNFGIELAIKQFNEYIKEQDEDI